MAIIKISTQDQLDEALKNYDISDTLRLEGSGLFIFRGSSAPRIVARESSAPRIEARGSSAPRIEAWESSAPRIEARESSAPRIEAWGSSAPRIVAWESSAPSIVAWGSSAPRIEAWGSSAPRIEAWESSAPRIEARESSALKGSISPYSGMILALRDRATSAITGSNILMLPEPKIQNAADWCAYYGVPVKDGVAILFKGVNEDYSTNGHQQSSKSLKPVFYLPGSTPKAEDWDQERECGGGLHFSPSPLATLQFHSQAKHFMACPVLVSEILVHPNGAYPNKVKAPRVIEPGCYEVDRDGELINKVPDKKAKAKASR